MRQPAIGHVGQVQRDGVARAELVAWVSSQKGIISLRPDHKLALLRELPFEARVKAARGLVSKLLEVATQAKAA